MAGWLTRLFRSGSTRKAEQAEIEGRFQDAAVLYANGGDRQAAFRVLMRAAESALTLADRRAFATRAYSVAESDVDRMSARRVLGMVGLQEAETSPPERDEERRLLREAAEHLEVAGAYREAAKAFRLLGDSDSVERVLVLAGDVDAYEREASAKVEQDQLVMKRRSAVESFATLWASGDRLGAIDTLMKHTRLDPNDHEIRAMLSERQRLLLDDRSMTFTLDHKAWTLAMRLPLRVGREADLTLRGAGVSREHASFDRNASGKVTVTDLGSRNGTLVLGLPIRGALELSPGQVLTLGVDLSMRVEHVDERYVELEVDRGMDRGRKIVLMLREWACVLGTIRLQEGRVFLFPNGTVLLAGQRVAAPIVLARGDRIEREGVVMDIPADGSRVG